MGNKKEVTNAKICGIMLASGLSRRFQSNKLLAKVDDRSIFEHSLMAAINSGIFIELIVVTCYEEIKQIAKMFSKVTVIDNQHNNKGMSESIKLGIKHASIHVDGYMFLMADQPFITLKTYEAIARKFCRPEDIIVPQYGDSMGSPKLFASRYKDEFTTLSGDSGGREIIKNHKQCVKIVYIDEEYENRDIDYIEDLDGIIVK